MKNKGTKLKFKKKGSENAFGCDLTEHLQNSGHDVPQVLKKCAEFIEKHGIVDGIYRLSGVTSNIQRLRQEFCSEACPDLTKEVYLQDIHCVGSLCKLYFRELPNPLLTYELYSKFTEAVSVLGDHERLLHIQRVIKELPTSHFRTLEYLTKHLAHLATLSKQTNMHTRNLALVWAPNLLRCKDIEASSGNGDMAFQEVRIQQSVVEFILNNTEHIFSGDLAQFKPKEGLSLMCGEKYATLPISGQGGPMKLMSLEEAQARSLSPNHPVHKERQRENSLPDTSTATLYHTVIDVTDNKRKLSGKTKRWKSIFNLGRSVDSKGKLSRNGSVFIKAQGITEKAALRPSRSMESLCSLPTDDDRTGSNSTAGGVGSFFKPDVKSRTLGSDSLYDLSEDEQNWEFKGIKASGATASWSSNHKGSPGASTAPQKALPEQLKVFKGDDLSGYKPTSPQNRRMLYSGSSHNSSSRPSFPGNFFPLESSPRHQRRAVNISEPFAVSVPLRVSAVISSNSTPCRAHAKDKAATLKASRESSEPSGTSGKSNTFPLLEPKKQEGAQRKNKDELTSRASPQDTGKGMMQEGQEERNSPELEPLSPANTSESKDTAPSTGKEAHSQPHQKELDKVSPTGNELWSELHQELKITEPDRDQLDDSLKAVHDTDACQNPKLTMDVKSKRSRSSPSLTFLCREQTSDTSPGDGAIGAHFSSARKQPSESDILLSLHKPLKTLGVKTQSVRPAEAANDKDKMSPKEDEPVHSEPSRHPAEEANLDQIISPLTIEDAPVVTSFLGADDADMKPQQHKLEQGEQSVSDGGAKRSAIPELELIQRLSVCLEERRRTLELPILDDDEGGNQEELDLVESWEDLHLSKQWVTSPLHSPDVEELFNSLSPFSSHGETQSSDVARRSPPPVDNTQQALDESSENFSGNLPVTGTSRPDTKWTHLPSVPARTSGSYSAQAPTGKSSTAKQKNPVSSHRFNRQTSHESAVSMKREENGFLKHRPYSLNLDLGHRYIRDISNQQNQNASEFASCQRGLVASSGTVSNGLSSDLELFLSDCQAPLRRNSAPVSVSSVRTAFMIKTCQAKAVPVIPPKVQYSQIPHSRQESEVQPAKEQEKKEKAYVKAAAEKSNSAPPPVMLDLKEELENKEPANPKPKPSANEKSVECGKATSTPELPVITRRHAPSLEVFVDCPRPSRGNLLQRPSFRNRQRPQSLILLSPPFPIMDYPTAGDDSKLLRSLNDAAAANVFSKEVAENLRAPEGITLQNKMTIPKSGQRLETSTSCFYQPQRRSMIFDSRSQRQIE